MNTQIVFRVEEGVVSWRLTSIMEMAAGLTVDAQDQLIEHIKGMYDAGQHRKASSDRNDELRGLIDMLLDMMKDNNHALEEAYLFLNRLYGRS